eukprot:TRINITY_DN24776_c0_g1_i1.p1 TRINITY_DN24776_c0_g1~~TRINITY_DN24776_c0_g1_i1.p1  ORF type:complete len:926 (+),score=294.15 TRINITY_DN24776_c0_g1_i1:131-2779(+)
MALTHLRGVYKLKRVQWVEAHEQAMFKLVDIAISLRKNLKDDLIIYRAFTREQQPETLERVLNHVVEEADKATANAQDAEEQAREITGDGSDLLDDSPEAALMKAVGGEELKERIQREKLTPWVKYLTDCYKNCMEICKKNPAYEDSFHKMAAKAFAFCKKHKQKIPFKMHFCRILRDHWTEMNHLDNASKKKRFDEVKQQQAEGKSDSKFHLMLAAHQAQLDVAVHFDNWQEAYRAIEEIHQRIEFFKVSPKVDIIIQYYTLLARIFWVSKNWLFHAYALYKLFIKKGDFFWGKGGGEEEKQKLASKVLLAVLSIPFWTHQLPNCITPFTNDSEREKAAKMTTLLGSVKPPSRESLLAEITSKESQILKLAHPKVVELYNIIERNIQPLNLADKVKPVFEWLGNNGLGDYSGHLQEVASVAVIVASSKVYSTLSLKALSEMCRFHQNLQIESLLVTVARAPASNVQLCIDHQSQSIKFDDANISSDILCATLPNLRKRMATINRMLMAKREEGEALQQKVSERRGLLSKRVISGLDEERESFIRRVELIDERRKEAEKAKEKEKQEEQTRLMNEKIANINEEFNKRDKEKARREKEAKEEANKMKNQKQGEAIISAIVAATSGRASDLERRLGSGAENIDTNELVEQGLKYMIDARYKAEQKRVNEWHKVHWLERACREFEAPLIRKAHDDKLHQQKSAFEARKANTLTQLRKDYDEAVETKKRLSRMEVQMEEFYASVLNIRKLDPSLIARAEKAVKDEDLEQELFDKVGRAGAGKGEIQREKEPEPSQPSQEEREPAKPSAAQESSNWRGGGDAPKESAPKKTFTARGASWQSEGADTFQSRKQADEPKEAPKAEEPAEEKPVKKSWGSNRKGGFKIDM